MLTEKQKIFCKKYIFDWNRTKAYRFAYPGCKTNNSACASANKLLINANISEYIEEIQDNLEKEAGISRLMIANEHKKIAFNSIAHLHNTWIERKEFDKLTDEQKDCISEIDTKITKKKKGDKVVGMIEYIKIKLYDKQKALDSLSKMFGHNEPEKHHHSGEIKGTPIVIQYKGKDISLSE